MNEADVSRCLNDLEARELRLYWETATDLDRILGWKGGVKRSGSRTRRRPRHARKASATTA